MLSDIFESVIKSAASDGFTAGSYLLCAGAALLLGVLSAIIYGHKNNGSAGFLVTLSLLPVAVQTVILLVNGNLGAGVAVAGAFSLVRFRSAPGGAREILSVFFAMAMGLAAGMGYLLLAALFFLVVTVAELALTAAHFGERSTLCRKLKITMPEDLDYNGVFDDVFSAYLKSADLVTVKTTNLGSMFELQYEVALKSAGVEKALIDALRVRNGNLNIVLSRLGEKGEL